MRNKDRRMRGRSRGKGQGKGEQGLRNNQEFGMRETPRATSRGTRGISGQGRDERQAPVSYGNVSRYKKLSIV